MAISTSTASAMTSEQLLQFLIQPLEKRSVVLSSGVRIFDGVDLRVPRQASGTALAFTAENGEIPTADYDYTGEVTLLPSTMKSVKVIVPFSNELARSSDLDIFNALQDRMVTDVAAALDNAMTNGTAANEPKGILAASSATIAGTAVGSPTVDDLYDAVGAALAADVDTAGLRWMMHSRDYINLHKVKADTAGSYLIQPDPTRSGVQSLLGHPIVVNNRMPTTGGAGNESTIVLADFSQVAVARDLSPTVTVLRERYAEYDQTALRVTARYDLGFLNEAAIVRLNGVTP